MADTPTFPIPTTPPEGYVPVEVKYEWANPCERTKWLMNLKYSRQQAGGQTKLIRTKSMDNEREVQFHAGLSESDLDKAIALAEDQCRALQGLPPIRRRFAIQMGSRRYTTRFTR